MDSPIHILFIEDNLGDARLVKEELQSASLKAAIQLEWVHHLETGLQRLAMTRLRRNTEFASTPIIALTALAMPGDRERCLQAGATEYMSKPVSLKILLQTIRNLLKTQPHA